jgi:hypothetical protein
MTGSSPSPLDIVRHAGDLDKKPPRDGALKIFTYGMLAVSGLAAVGHLVLSFVREIRRAEHENARGDRHSPALTSPPAEAATDEEERQPGKKWSHRPELADRQPQDDHAQAAHSRSHSHARQH